MVSDSAETTRPGLRTEPERVGRYLVYEPLASGGMARVHLGRLVGPVGFSRIVAIKRLHSHLAVESEFVSMFLDEARLAARVRHPNVVSILDVVSLPDELFLVLEYVPGESVGALHRAEVDAGRQVPPSIALAIVVGALTGLHAAHEAKSETGAPLEIVHRDVSPQNIIVGADGLARVLDFGIAYAAERLQMTRTGQVKGKPQYMSPEQISGKVVDRRTDVYAAGVVLWELLTGKRLFRGSTDAETYQLVHRGAPDVRSANPSVPPSLSAVVMKAVALDPEQRYRTAGEFALALEHAAPMASQRAVAEWVERVAGPVLAERARRVAHIESADHTPDGEVDAEGAEALSNLAPPASSASRVTGDMSAMRPATGERSSNRVWLALGGALLGAVSFCAVLLVVLAARRTPQPAEPAITAAPPPVVAAPTPAPSAPPPPVASDTPDAGTPPTVASAKPTAAPSKTVPRVDPCKEKFRWEHGLKLPKPNCFD